MFFIQCLQRPPLFFFLFCKRMDVQKLPKAPLLHFSALCDLPETRKISKTNLKKIGFFSIVPHAGTVEENTWHIEVLLLFLSLRFGADLGRSRLVYRESAVSVLRSFVKPFRRKSKMMKLSFNDTARRLCSLQRIDTLGMSIYWSSPFLVH